jgi:hypothetical protein
MKLVVNNRKLKTQNRVLWWLVLGLYVLVIGRMIYVIL